MSNALIDAILPAIKPTRPQDSATPRANERRGEFAPVLNHALGARPSEPAAAELDADDERSEEPGVAPSTADKTSESNNTSSDDEAGVGEPAETGELAEESTNDAEADESDVVEISAEAEAEAATVAAASLTAALLPPAPEANVDINFEASGVVEISADSVPTEETNTAKPQQNSAPANAATEAIATSGDHTAATNGTIAPANGAAEPNAELARDAMPTKAKTLRDQNSGAADSEVQLSSQESQATPNQPSTTRVSHEPAPAPNTQGDGQGSEGPASGRGAKKKSPDADRVEAKNDREPTTTAAAQADAAKALERIDVAGGESSDAASNELEGASAASAAPQSPEVGRPATSATALSRLAAERSLHVPAETSGDSGAVDRGRFVGRVEGAIRAAQQRDGRVQVRLSPPELGALRIELTIQQGALAARLEAETPAARNLLLDNLPALRERLAQQDIRVERFDVDLRQDAHSGGSGSHQGAMHERQPRETDWQQNQARPDRERTGAAASPPTMRSAGASAATDSGLDVRV